jgi:hypothetical protein
MLFSDEKNAAYFRNLSDVEILIVHLTQTCGLERDKEAHEDYSLCAFLTIGIIARKWSLPVTVIRRESPDFALTIGSTDRTIGVEHTCATTEKYKMDESIAENYPEGTVMELAHYSPSARLPKKSKAGIKRPGQKLDSGGWGDYGMENDCAQVVADAIRKKAEKLNEAHFARFPSNELIVEDVSHVSSLKRLDKTIQLLREKHGSCQGKVRTRFDRIHLITEHSFVYDVFNDSQATSLHKDDLLAIWKRLTA